MLAIPTTISPINFWIDLEHQLLQYRFLVKLLVADEQRECFQVTAGQSRLLITSNRPELRNLNRAAPTSYTLTEGTVASKQLLAKIYEAIDVYVEAYL